MVGFFYNPNIQPKAEYLKREGVAKQVARLLKFELILGTYDKDNWLSKTRGLENEPEGARRCKICFKMRIEEARKKASQRNISQFTSTLTISSHKNTAVINEIGKTLDPSGFLACDFKKKDGFRLAIEFAKRYNLYRQNYCGCIYSKNVRSIV